MWFSRSLNLIVKLRTLSVDLTIPLKGFNMVFAINSIKACLAALLTLCFALPASAASSIENEDRDGEGNNNFRGAIEIMADSAELDEKRGLTVYRGDVTIQQGEITIAADTVTLETQTETSTDASGGPSRTVSKIVASGSPARFTRHTVQQSEPIRAQGETIRYNVGSGIILLESNASIDRNGSVFSGEKIEYFIEQERVKAESNPNDKRGRVHTVFTPAAPNNDSQNNKASAEAE